MQAWRSGVQEVLDLVARKHEGTVIVPMTLIDLRYFAQIVGRLRDDAATPPAAPDRRRIGGGEHLPDPARADRAAVSARRLAQARPRSTAAAEVRFMTSA